MNSEVKNRLNRPGSMGRKRGWKPEAAAGKAKAVGPSASAPVRRKPKPKRPLSAYNLFFQHEREKIVGSSSPSSSSSSSAGSADNADALLSEIISNKGRLHLPSRESEDDSSSVHRRRGGKAEVHGKIGFKELARTISQKWKALDESSRAIYDALAILEKKRYEREMEAWDRERIEEAERQLAELEKAEKDGVAKKSSPSPHPSVASSSGESSTIGASGPESSIISLLSDGEMSGKIEAHKRCALPEKKRRRKSSAKKRRRESSNPLVGSPPADSLSSRTENDQATFPRSGTWRAVSQNILARRQQRCPSFFDVVGAPPSPSSSSFQWGPFPYRSDVAAMNECNASAETTALAPRRADRRPSRSTNDEEMLRMGPLYEPSPIVITDDQRMQMQLYSPTPIGADGADDSDATKLDKESVSFLSSVFFSVVG